MRIACGIEYDGSRFCGWQRQGQGVRTVQQVVEEAVGQVANHKVRSHCAGRTDTGVHAVSQVIHFDTSVERHEHSWVSGTNANLTKEVAMLWARPVSDDFHARFSARRRRYRYVIYNRSVHPTFLFWRVSWVYRPLDETRMAEAARCLVGEHDFSSYRAQGCQARSPVRTIYEINLRRADALIFIDIEANAFLHHMVRNIAGVLIAIGSGERPTDWSAEVLSLRERASGGVTASPHGLYLVHIDYPDEFALPVLPSAVAVW